MIEACSEGVGFTSMMVYRLFGVEGFLQTYDTKRAARKRPTLYYSFQDRCNYFMINTEQALKRGTMSINVLHAFGPWLACRPVNLRRWGRASLQPFVIAQRNRDR